MGYRWCWILGEDQRPGSWVLEVASIYGKQRYIPDAPITSSVHVLNNMLQVPALSLCLLQITWEDLKAAEQAVGDFGSDNRAGVQGTLHRISAMRSRKGTVVGLTCRVGRAVTGHVDMIRDILDGDTSLPHCVLWNLTR